MLRYFTKHYFGSKLAEVKVKQSPYRPGVAQSFPGS